MDGAINRFCETLRLLDSLRLEQCGIDQNNQFVFGRKIEFGEYRNLIRALSNNPDLRHLANRSVVYSQDLPSLNYLYSANEVNRTLLNGVTLAICNNGLLAWVRRKNLEQAYGIVSSVDWGMQLNRGIARAIKDKLGGNDSDYYQASQRSRIEFGECFTFDFIGEGKPPDLTNCQAVHNVLVPVATDGAFITKLKDAVLKIFQEADSRGLRRIFCPLLGCGNAGGSGKALATAVAQAKYEFESTGKQVPELILVGMSSSDKDKEACKAFEQQWNRLVRQNPATPSRTPPASHVPSAGASASLSAAVLDPVVTLVTCMGGLLTWVGRENANARISYGIVNSVDLGKTLNSGIAKVIKDKFGTDYQRASESQLLGYGICATYYCSRFNNPPDLSNCHAVHNVMIPPSTHPDFDVHLKNAFIEVFKAAMGNKLNRVFCPLLGCGIANGSGTRLATAVLAAKEFFKPSGSQLPKLILVGRSSEARDIQAGKDFARQWQASGQYRPATGSAVTPTSAWATATVNNTATTTVSGNNVPIMLIPGQLGIMMYADNGMFGYARELSKQGKPFDLVNAANSQMSHGGGIAQRFSRELGAQFDSDTGSNAPVPTGTCYTTGSYGYSDPKSDLHHCQYIHNVVAPNKKEYEVSVNRPGAGVKTHFQRTRYEQDFTSAFVSLLLAAMTRGSDTIVSCFIGCAIFGGSGEDMARALHGAYQKLGIPLLKLPKLILVGWRGADQNVYDDFIQTFKRLNIADPVCLPSGKMPASASPAGISGIMPRSGAIPKKTSPDFLSGAALFSRSMPDSLPPTSHSPYSLSDELASLSISPEPPAKVPRTTSRYALSDRTEVSGSGESAASAFSGSEEAIDCGVCYKSKPKEDSLQYQGIQVCAECTKEYPDLNLHSSTKLAEEYAAINYSPLEVKRSREELPGYPGVGRIIVHIKATAPAQLSERKLDETSKCETHYLPDNEVGNELLELLKVLHEEKLIYKIDQSNTTGKFAITFNFHLKTSDTGGVPRHGYPDSNYPCRAADQIVGLAKTHALEEKLDVTKLLNLLSDGSS